jgi:putative ABC transport system permease protein
VSASSKDDLPRAQSQVSTLLRDRHHVTADMDDDFNIRTLTEMASALQSGVGAVTMLLAIVAMVSLVVGGIGIMNIMLVSVTERTREIGLRMAVGARPRDILWQFLVESVALSATGGLIGVALALGLASVLTKAIGWPMVFRPDVVALSVGFSAVVGIVFGLFPARKASSLDPIDALRYE